MDDLHPAPRKDIVIASVLELAVFERFVFVMSVLEGHSDEDCSVLLQCSPNQIGEARARALQLMAKSYAKNAAASTSALTH